MKTIFIPARSKTDIKKVLSKFKSKEKFGIVTTIQYIDQIKNLKIKNAIIVKKPVLGCDASACKEIKDKVKSILYIGTGHFHPIRVALETGLPVFIANPETDIISKLPEEDIAKHKLLTKGKLLRFLSAEKVGILISVKPGQYDLDSALKLKQELKNKEIYLFFFNTLNEVELENFRFIDFWINTACYRIESKNIINIEDLPK